MQLTFGPLTVRLVVTPAAEVLDRLDRIDKHLTRLEARMAGELDALEASVTNIDNVIDSAMALMGGLSQQLKDAIASGNPARISAVVATLDAKRADLAAAVVANTAAVPVVSAAPPPA